MTETKSFNWMRLWFGMVVVGVVTVIYAAAVVQGSPTTLLGVLLAALILVLAAWLYYRGKREIAIGLIAGYGLLSLVSQGQCTLLVTPYDEYAALGGLLLYPMALAAVLVIGAVVSRIAARRKENHE